MSDVALLPCPFCGGKAELLPQGVCCNFALCASHDIQATVEQWNTRTPTLGPEAMAFFEAAVRHFKGELNYASVRDAYDTYRAYTKAQGDAK